MVANKSPKGHKKISKKIPNSLICEVIDGRPFYFKGYEEVLNGEKTPEDIMGSSSLQAFIISFLLKTLYKNLDETQFILFTNEAGLHLDKRNNLAGDILIYDRKDVSIDAINENYFAIPPKIVIEVDIAVDPASLTAEGYVHTKTRKLLDFGVEKVIWVMTPGKTVIVATPSEDWLIKDWNKEVEILVGIQVNLGEFLKKEGSKFA